MELINLEKCDVCRAKNVKGIVACSMFGAQTFAYCEDCMATYREPYRAMVDYIAAAGHWPQDINEAYQAEVRRQLKLHNIPEEVFKLEVERAIAEEQAALIEICGGRLEF